MHTNRFPGESGEYRAARNELLRAERDLRDQVERVAALRRKLPLGGLIPQDYVFEEGAAEHEDTREVRMSEAFAPKKNTLVLYSFMFAPDADACPMCTSFIDGLNGNAMHITQRVNLAVVAKSPLARLRQFARGRDWRNIRLWSSANNSFNHDFLAESPSGAQLTILHVFVKRPDGVHHFYSTELNMLPPEPGQNQRHLDLMWPLWNVLDVTPEGRGTDWYPSLSY